MKVVKNIQFEWWTGEKEEPNPDHAEALEESAMSRIMEMVQEGYTSGELIDNIKMSENDPEDGTPYRGWWSISDQDVSKSFWYVVNGRIPGDDEDTCVIVEALEQAEAVDKFAQELWEESLDADPADVEERYGARIIITSIAQSKSQPILKANG